MHSKSIAAQQQIKRTCTGGSFGGDGGGGSASSLVDAFTAMKKGEQGKVRDFVDTVWTS